MIDYRRIAKFKYENNYYQLLLDDNDKYFFLKINENGDYEYITLPELVKLTKLFYVNDDVYCLDNDKKRKLSIVPRVIIGGVAATLTLPVLTLVYYKESRANRQNPLLTTNPYQTTVSYETTYNKEIPTEETTNNNDKLAQQAINSMLENIKIDKKDFKVETSGEGLDLKLIYDSSALDDVFGYKKDKITYDDIRNTIKNNNNISDKYEKLYINLANNLEKQFPNMDLRIWHHNLKTMKIVECDDMQMKVKALSVTAYGCYRRDENTIYTVKDYNYKPGTWEYQVIIHEMCHPIRTSTFEMNGTEINTKFTNASGRGTIVDEALNSLLSLRSYDKKERDVAYQLQSNMLEVIVDCMDNYTYQDYVEHNITYFENELNKQNKNDLAVDMLSLMDLQYKDYHDTSFSIEQEEFYSLYDYIAKMYYKKHLNSSMDYGDAKDVKNELIDKITYDVPKEYNIDLDHFDDYFNNYIEKLNIKKPKTK